MLTKTDFEVILGILFLSCYIILTIMAWKRSFPSVDTLTDIALLFNTKGGIIMLLASMWIGSLLLTVFFAMWVIIRGVDPEHAVVITLLGMLTSNAFGNVNGALFKTMTGEDPKNGKMATMSSTTSTTTTEATKP